MWIVADHEELRESSESALAHLIPSLVGFIAFLDLCWLLNCGYTSRVVGSSIGVTHAFMSLAQDFSSDALQLKLMACSTIQFKCGSYWKGYFGLLVLLA
jgi:hypothetical protein